MSTEFDDFDDEFDDDLFDESALNQIDQLERNLTTSKSHPPPLPPPLTHQLTSSKLQPTHHSDLFDEPWDDSLLAQLDSNPNPAAFRAPPDPPSSSKLSSPNAKSFTNGSLIDTTPSGASRPLSARPLFRTSSSSSETRSGWKQRNLFGEIVPDTPKWQSQGPFSLSSQVGASSSSNGIRVGPSRTKQWNRTAYAKSGQRLKNGGGKGKGKSRGERGEAGEGAEEGGEDFDGEQDWDSKRKAKSEFQIPQPKPEELPPLLPMKQRIDLEEAKTWIYPINMPLRDYQYNIVQKALFSNVLVALPTGLGKTFIAAVVILNFYRWYPQGKIIFVAPTKPLVQQQQRACHGICGLPWDAAIELTGSTKVAMRGDHWQTKRIFYMTPQTFYNDLQSESCDARDIVCLVVDEAHHSLGRYSYSTVVAHIMQRNPYFRVLALSATPGSTSEKVQEVIDNLHISSIELRTEDALDIRKYLHKKHEELIKVPLGVQVNRIIDNWAQLMRTHMTPLSKAGILREQNPIALHDYACTAAGSNPRFLPTLREKPYLRNHLAELGKMARCMQYLVEQSLTMFYVRIKEMCTGTDSKGKKAATKRQRMFSTSNSIFKEVLQGIEMLQEKDGRLIHPKMSKLKEVMNDHFNDHAVRMMEEAEARELNGRGINGGTPMTQRETRAIVFCSFRENVTEIVEYLNSCGLKATQFVGQSTDGRGNRGFTQKDQERVIQEFKQGKFNIIVATSIGEEGLDIGEVDLIVIYEAVRNCVRMLQRVGRTGRKRDGKIVVLLTEGRGEQNWKHAKEAYKSVQKDINAGINVELYDDAERMVPADITPVPLLKEVDQPIFEPAMIPTARTAATKKRKKRDDDPRRNAPDGAIMGFFKASELRAKAKRDSGSCSGRNGSGGGRNASDEERGSSSSSEDEHRRARRILADDSDDDSQDEMLAAGLDFNVRKKGGDKGLGEDQCDERRKQSSRSTHTLLKVSPSSSSYGGGGDLDGSGSSFSDVARSGSISRTKAPKTKGKRLGTRACASRSSDPHRNGGSIPYVLIGPGTSQMGEEETFCSSKVEEVTNDSDKGLGRVPTGRVKLTVGEEGMGSNLDPESVAMRDGNGEKGKEREVDVRPSLLSPPPPSPVATRRRRPHPIIDQLLLEGLDPDECLLDYEDDDEDGGEADRGRQDGKEDGEEEEEVEGPSSPLIPRGGRGLRGGRRLPNVIPSSPVAEQQGGWESKTRLTTTTTTNNSNMAPPPSVPKRRRRPAIPEDDDEDEEGNPWAFKERSEPNPPPPNPPITHNPPSLETPTRTTGKRQRRTIPPSSEVEGSKKNKRKKGKRRIGNSPTSKALFRYEAERSTDEEVHGEKDEKDEGIDTDQEDDEDRAAVGMFEPTQAPKGYDQYGVYAQSLLSQAAPTPFRRPNGTGGRGPFPGLGGRFGLTTVRSPTGSRYGTGGFHHHRLPSSSTLPQRHNLGEEASSDRYSEDSFCVNDDDEILYDSQTSGPCPGSSQI
ncbi:P-loop containing nucleoside triphosphate hydrolase protein [Violaceomyces palustris]|uniref:P-loop containing nucleoside triphosphate hydrolase protein n=1 Tax=Violaceomyces palustris TaxID=1673888 RepID=A0ACD0NVX1_9BASI|nr:P-loop containing nucleoside triphosphate hydrolase protein [Violaceomyces palustris]